MTPTLRAFVTRLTELQGDGISIAYSSGPPPTATIMAQDERVGDMNVYDDGDELTVEIGDKHHTHVSEFSYGRHPDTERLQMVARDAAEFVNDVMSDRVCITVDFKGNRCVGSSHSYVDEGEGDSSLVRAIGDSASLGGYRSVRYLWSGPID